MVENLTCIYRIIVAICMDLNAYSNTWKWKVLDFWELCEFASRHLDNTHRKALADDWHRTLCGDDGCVVRQTDSQPLSRYELGESEPDKQRTNAMEASQTQRQQHKARAHRNRTSQTIKWRTDFARRTTTTSKTLGNNSVLYHIRIL